MKATSRKLWSVRMQHLVVKEVKFSGTIDAF